MRTLKHIILLFTILSFKIVVFSQDQIKFNTIDSIGFLSVSVISIDSNYYTIGDLWNHEQYRSSVVKKYNSHGVLETFDTIKQFPILTLATGEITPLDKGFIFTSIYQADIPYTDDKRDILISKYDENFNLVFEKVVGTIKQDVASYVTEDNRKNIIVAGTTTYLNPNSAFILIKLDSLGNLLWQKIISTPYGGCRSACKTGDNGIIMSGFCFIPPTQTALGHYDSFIIKLDSLGNEEWRKSFGTPYDDDVAYSQNLSDKTIIVSSSIGIQNSIFKKGKITKYSLSGKQIWSKTYMFGISTWLFNKPIQLHDGSLIFTGLMKDENQINNWFIMKTDPFGNFIWKRDFFPNSITPLSIYGIKDSSDGGLIFCGSARDNLSNQQRPWLVKTDCFGCDGVACDSTGVVCDVYDCNTKDFYASINPSALNVDLFNSNRTITFSDDASQTSNREWILPDTTIYAVSSVNYTFNTPGTYPVTLINYHGVCSDTSLVMVEVEYGLGLQSEKNIENAVKIFPNPNNGKFEISKNSEKNISINLKNSIGQSVYSDIISDSSQKISLTLAPGVYFAIFSDGNHTYGKKIIITTN
jgi:hypothetical protein